MGFKDRKGEVNRATNGMLMTIVEYRGCDDLDIQFEDGVVVKNKQYNKFQNGRIKHPFLSTKSTGKNIEHKRLNNSFNAWYHKHKEEYICRDDAYNYYINNVKIDNSININNKKYKSFRDMCLNNNVHPDTIKNYFNRTIAKELHLSVNNIEHVMLVINMYNNIRNNGVHINENIIHNLSDIKGYSRDILTHIHKIILYSDNIQSDIDRYIEKINKENEKISNNKDIKRKELEEFKTKCSEADIEIGSEEYAQVCRIKNNHKDWSIEYCIKYALNEEDRTEYRNKRDNYKKFREKYNIDNEEFKQISSYVRNQHKKGINVSLLDALQHVRKYNKNVDKEWKDKWNELVKADILDYAHRSSVREYMKKHTDYNVEDIINHFMHEKRDYKKYPKLKEYCELLQIKYESIVAYMHNKNCNITDAIVHFRPDCYINILGELVIPK